jgi:hypothetical protein
MEQFNVKNMEKEKLYDAATSALKKMKKEQLTGICSLFKIGWCTYRKSKSTAKKDKHKMIRTEDNTTVLKEKLLKFIVC